MSGGNGAGPRFRAVAERHGPGWTVEVEGLAGPSRFEARDLADVEPRALKLVWGYTGVDYDHIEVEVRLPGAIQDRLEVIGQHCDDIEAEWLAVVVELVELRVPLLDVAAVLALHYRAPRPLTITNAEVAMHGLARHQLAVGMEWADHGFALTRLCRRHVELARLTYVDLDPAGVNALVYPATEFRCDRCHEGDDVEAEAAG